MTPPLAQSKLPAPNSPSPEEILVSVIILNYNGLRWIDRCLESLKRQTLLPRIEVIVADNLSSDGSDRAFEAALQSLPRARFIQNGANLGFCEGNNRPARLAQGKFLFFLNNDTWLEPDCLEALLRETQTAGARMATPLMLNYDDDSLQSAGGAGFDIFGLISWKVNWSGTEEIFVVGGCCCLIEKELFERLGGFDPEFFMYADEYDLSWRAWIAGAKAVLVPAARMHHRSSGQASAKEQPKGLELRTSDAKRFYANRNSLVMLLKNCQHLLLLLVPLQVALLAAEAAASALLVRRWSFIKTAYWKALTDCWRLRGHIARERRRLATVRQRGDVWMLRFLRWRLNRLNEVKHMLRLGVPKVTKS